ncbi:hypothetical protein BABINDRAFT_109750 [Babjeviella inositovora NRRL Y-12698]|uniref:Uncharacterized protein n=1 Tax=Babjeviella inositovora NRRL Y-12698 TaxID=984486 RepID=A0A1E3QVF5_9ASCO|nr:uncharacterized protein BABINDRAFT_109750 [Babjeviella inositovora NRRL Y-12698]ODQ81641.1 hypothetical protein BABINDRAFT_109750 [Babjeviella inositovora NRRL Y-12698]
MKRGEYTRSSARVSALHNLFTEVSIPQKCCGMPLTASFNENIPGLAVSMRLLLFANPPVI